MFLIKMLVQEQLVSHRSEPVAKKVVSAPRLKIQLDALLPPAEPWSTDVDDTVDDAPDKADSTTLPAPTMEMPVPPGLPKHLGPCRKAVTSTLHGQ